MQKSEKGIPWHILEDAWPDSMHRLHLRCDQAVFSHETALLLHNLTDRETILYAITGETGYRPSNPVYDIGRSRSEIEIQTFQDAMKRYAQLNNRNI